jgi:hypothetical protein
VQKNAGYDDLKFQMMKLDLMYDSLSNECKKFIDSQLPLSSENFKEMLLKAANTIPKNVEIN